VGFVCKRVAAAASPSIQAFTDSVGTGTQRSKLSVPVWAVTSPHDSLVSRTTIADFSKAVTSSGLASRGIANCWKKKERNG
jgi:hypothetical protein